MSKKRKTSINDLITHDILYTTFSYIFIYELLNRQRICKRWKQFVWKEIKRRIDNKERRLLQIFTKDKSEDVFLRTIRNPVTLNKRGNIKKFTKIVALMETLCEKCLKTEDFDKALRNFRRNHYTLPCCKKSFFYCCEAQKSASLYSDVMCLTKCHVGFHHVCKLCNLFECSKCQTKLCKKHIKTCVLCDKKLCKDHYYRCVQCGKKQIICKGCLNENFLKECWRCENIWFDEEFMITHLKGTCKVYKLYLTELQKHLDYDICDE